MKGNAESNNLQWGGTTSGNTCTISDLLVENNILYVTSPTYSLWEAIGFRGFDPFNTTGNGGKSTITLTNFAMIGNNITCAPLNTQGNNCNILNIGLAHLNGTTTISRNIAYGNNLTDGFCPFKTFNELIPVLTDNQQVNFTECTNQVIKVSIKPTKAPKPTKASKPTKSPKKTKAGKM